MTRENAEKVINGTKTQTRRTGGLEEINGTPDKWVFTGNIGRENNRYFKNGREFRNDSAGTWEQRWAYLKPRYLPGETVYLKEAHYVFGVFKRMGYKTKNGSRYATRFERLRNDMVYYPDNAPNDLLVGNSDGVCDVPFWYNRSPMFMEEKDARHFCNINDVRPERLQDITIQDIVQEGISPCSDSLNWVDTTRNHFISLWDSINGKKKGYAWKDNPWVWRYEFQLLIPDERE